MPGRTPVAAGLFAAGLVVQGFHSLEHVAQVVQKYGLGRSEAHGLLGSIFDTEWVHFLYNAALLALLLGVIGAAGAWAQARWRTMRPWGWTLLAAGVWTQGYHFFEHRVRLVQFLETGAEPAPGLLGQVLDLTWLHFGINAVVYGLMFGAFFALKFAYCPAIRVVGRRNAVTSACPLAAVS